MKPPVRVELPQLPQNFHFKFTHFGDSTRIECIRETMAGGAKSVLTASVEHPVHEEKYRWQRAIQQKCLWMVHILEAQAMQQQWLKEMQ